MQLYPLRDITEVAVMWQSPIRADVHRNRDIVYMRPLKRTTNTYCHRLCTTFVSNNSNSEIAAQLTKACACIPVWHFWTFACAIQAHALGGTISTEEICAIAPFSTLLISTAVTEAGSCKRMEEIDH